MVAKVLVYVHYDSASFASDLNAWIQINQKEDTIPCWDIGDVSGFTDAVCAWIMEAYGGCEVDLKVVQDAWTDNIGFCSEFTNRNRRLLDKKESLWTEDAAAEIIRTEFNCRFQGNPEAKSSSYSGKTAEPQEEERNTEFSGKAEKVPLADLMRKVAGLKGQGEHTDERT